MNISPVSFGKTVKVNMSTNDAGLLIDLLNSKTTNHHYHQLQQDAKAIFNDTFEGAAVFCSPDEGKSCYIVTGQESGILSSLRKKTFEVLEAVMYFYDEGPFLDKNIQYITRKENREVNNLIRSTKENYILTLADDEKTGLPRLRKFSIVG